jgi:hypothetical protein
VRPCD